MLFEGILIHKQIYKERDVIASFLLRSGDIISGYFYGGRGGGNSKKSDILQLGYCLKFKVHEPRKKSSAVTKTYKITDWSIIWQHEVIRKNYNAFVFMNYLCELHNKLSLPIEDISEVGLAGNQDIFTNLSNSLFWLDKFPKKPTEIKKIVYIKLSYYLGILPDAGECQFCESNLTKLKSFLFFEEGRAACVNCLPSEGNHLGAWVAPGFFSHYQGILQGKFQDGFRNEEKLESLELYILEKYIWNHFNFKQSSFKSLSWQK